MEPEVIYGARRGLNLPATSGQTARDLMRGYFCRGSSRLQKEAQPMAHDAEMTQFPLTAEAPARSAAAERMRLHRERRREGLRCLMIELRETEIEALIRKGFLRAEMRNDQNAVSEALYAFLDRTLGVTP
jgi:hypothetical protein